MDNIDKKRRPKMVRIPEPMTLWVEAALRELKARGAEVSAEDLLATAFGRINEDYFKRRVQELTPDHHLLEVAKGHPEVLRILSQQAKKLLGAVEKGEPVRLRRKRERSGQAGEAN